MKAVGNGAIHLLLKGNFEWSTECDKYDKIHQTILQISVKNYEVRIDETRNRSREWNLIIDVDIFHIYSISNHNTIERLSF